MIFFLCYVWTVFENMTFSKERAVNALSPHPIKLPAQMVFCCELYAEIGDVVHFDKPIFCPVIPPEPVKLSYLHVFVIASRMF